MNPKQLKLPEFAFIDGSEHEANGNPTEGRTIIIHIRTATILELFDAENDEFALNPETQTFRFENKNTREHFIFALHYSFSDDMQPVFEAAANWYIDYCAWEDNNIAGEYFETNN